MAASTKRANSRSNVEMTACRLAVKGTFLTRYLRAAGTGDNRSRGMAGPIYQTRAARLALLAGVEAAGHVPAQEAGQRVAQDEDSHDGAALREERAGDGDQDHRQHQRRQLDAWT